MIPRIIRLGPLHLYVYMSIYPSCQEAIYLSTVQWKRNCNGSIVQNRLCINCEPIVYHELTVHQVCDRKATVAGERGGGASEDDGPHDPPRPARRGTISGRRSGFEPLQAF